MKDLHKQPALSRVPKVLFYTKKPGEEIEVKRPSVGLRLSLLVAPHVNNMVGWSVHRILPRKMAVALGKGKKSVITAQYDPLSKTVILQSLSLSAKLGVKTSVRDALEILKRIEGEARNIGARRVITSPTHLPENAARRAGYLVKKRLAGVEERYIYEKKL